MHYPIRASVHADDADGGQPRRCGLDHFFVLQQFGLKGTLKHIENKSVTGCSYSRRMIATETSKMP